MQHDFTDQLERARDRIRNFEIHGVRYTLRAEDPHGFWYVRNESGKTDDKLKGAYTSFAAAELAVKRHEEERFKTRPARENLAARRQTPKKKLIPKVMDVE